MHARRYASIWMEVDSLFRNRPSMFRLGFLPERLLGTRLRSEAAGGTLKVRVIDSLQWGVRREAAAREYGCRHALGCGKEELQPSSAIRVAS